eukprot:Sspe_Gene.98928::Locus_72330_Transcript_1_2_Confidence_0.667_Length_1145::g.98928::m.98928
MEEGNRQVLPVDDAFLSDPWLAELTASPQNGERSILERTGITVLNQEGAKEERPAEEPKPVKLFSQTIDPSYTKLTPKRSLGGVGGRRYEGKVKSWNLEKGYGFILYTTDTGFAEAYVHAKNINNMKLIPGKDVSFNVEPLGKNGQPWAVNVEGEGLAPTVCRFHLQGDCHHGDDCPNPHTLPKEARWGHEDYFRLQDEGPPAPARQQDRGWAAGKLGMEYSGERRTGGRRKHDDEGRNRHRDPTGPDPARGGKGWQGKGGGKRDPRVEIQVVDSGKGRKDAVIEHQTVPASKPVQWTDAKGRVHFEKPSTSSRGADPRIEKRITGGR